MLSNQTRKIIEKLKKNGTIGKESSTKKKRFLSTQEREFIIKYDMIRIR